MLRGYQDDIVHGVRKEIAKGNNRPVVVAPTGSGKTHIATSIIAGCEANRKSTLFFAPRRELIYQTANKFYDYGLDLGMIMHGEGYRLHERHQVASFDTVHARSIRSSRLAMPEADVVIVDEAHLSMSDGRQAILEHYKDKIVIGLTATPALGDGSGLGSYYNGMVNEVSVRELMDQGYLVEPEYYAPTTFDLQGVKQTRADYQVNSLASRVDRPELIGQITDNWLRLAGGRRTVVFCTTIAHSMHVCAEFNAMGVKAEHVDANTESEERQEIFNRVRSGETTVLCNVFVASYGLDIPPVEVCVLARPTKNLSLYIQTCGRVLRPSPETGKTKATIIDHTGAVKMHGFLDDPVPWSLNCDDIREDKRREEANKKEKKEVVCHVCATVFKAAKECPKCGAELQRAAKEISATDDKLQKVDQNIKEKPANREYSYQRKQEFFNMLLYYCRGKGYKDGWASMKYRDKFGVWPNEFQRRAVPAAPNEEVTNFIRSQQIRYAMARKAS